MTTNLVLITEQANGYNEQTNRHCNDKEKGHTHDYPKQKFLNEQNLSILSKWFVGGVI